jgi:hypothetical protein
MKSLLHLALAPVVFCVQERAAGIGTGGLLRHIGHYFLTPAIK